ncbi:hypothetical protein ZWY2020_020860 [Hordeum vulgare]|nr:hypothetical protein ZWY2020_020860 [Hordeum vulgare]
MAPTLPHRSFPDPQHLLSAAEPRPHGRPNRSSAMAEGEPASAILGERAWPRQVRRLLPSPLVVPTALGTARISGSVLLQN